VSTPIISRTVAARLKLFGDRLLGPNADAAIIEGLTALRREGREPAVPFRVDERVLKPRVAGFLAVGGSLTSQWKTLAHADHAHHHVLDADRRRRPGAVRRGRHTALRAARPGGDRPGRGARA
jgi:multimeric flavodoxin WrbA